jgi:hypothetical protein
VAKKIKQSQPQRLNIATHRAGGPLWVGDLEGECKAKWRGLVLKADFAQWAWWWGVFDSNGNKIDESSCHTGKPESWRGSGYEARKDAELAARKFLSNRALQEVP